MTKVGAFFCRKYFDLTDFAQLTFRSEKWIKKGGKKKPHASLDFSKSTNEKQVWNGLRYIFLIVKSLDLINNL